MNCKEKVYCGVDVSRLHLDVLFKGRPRRFPNTIKGVESMRARIGNVHYVLESTGGYERMAAVCAIQHNPVMKEFYIRLVEENHRPKKVALTAVMRKLIIAANSAVKNPDFGVVI